MKRLPMLMGLLAICMAFLTGCGDEEDATGGGGAVGGIVGNAPATVNGAEYDITEPTGTSTISFTIAGRNYTLTRPGMATETGSFVANKVGNDTWDVTLNNALDGSVSRLVLTFTSTTSGNFSFTPPTGPTINGQFRRSGFGSTTTGSTTTGTTTTGTTTTGTTTTGTTTTGTTTTGTTTTGTTTTAAPATISQIVFNGRAGNPSGAGQIVVNITGGTFTYSGNGASGNGTVTYSPSGTSSQAQLLLNYNGSNDFDDYVLQFNAPSGSPILSAYSGTQRVGLTTGSASGTFTYTQ